LFERRFDGSAAVNRPDAHDAMPVRGDAGQRDWADRTMTRWSTRWRGADEQGEGRENMRAPVDGGSARDQPASVDHVDRAACSPAFAPPPTGLTPARSLHSGSFDV
jgi:hypothetical protein